MIYWEDDGVEEEIGSSSLILFFRVDQKTQVLIRSPLHNQNGWWRVVDELVNLLVFFFFFFFWAIKVERRGLLMSWSISSILFLSPPPSLLPSQSDVMMKLKEIKGCWDGNGMFVFVLSLLIRLRNWPNTIWTDLFYPQAPRFINFGAIHAVERME